jgi:hypothetical protein
MHQQAPIIAAMAIYALSSWFILSAIWAGLSRTTRRIITNKRAKEAQKS